MYPNGPNQCTQRIAKSFAIFANANMRTPLFHSLPPSQIVPALADEGRYLAPESSFC